MVILSASLLLLGGAFSQLSYKEAWNQEQATRQKFGAVIYDPKATDEALRDAVAGLRTLAEWCLSEPIRGLKSDRGTPDLYYQRNDIFMDEMSGLARLKDAEGVRSVVRALHDSLIAPDTWLTGSNVAFYSVYANNISHNEYLLKLPKDPEVARLVADLSIRDPGRVYRGTPYSGEDGTRLSAADRVAGLSMLWSEAKYNFANFDLVGGLDWDEAYRTYLPLVTASKDPYAYYNLLREFMALLKDSHTDVGLPPSMAMEKEFKPPLYTKLVEGKVVVGIEPPAEVAAIGFKKGDVIEQIDGVDAVTYGASRWGKLVSCSTPQDRAVRIYTYMLLRGPLGASVRLSCLSADGQRVTRVLPRTKNLGRMVIPPSSFKILSDGTAYFAFNTSGSNEPAESFLKHLPEIQAAGKLVIDCRMNDGGSTDVGYSILGHLVSKSFVGCKWRTADYRPSFRTWNEAMTPYEATSTVEAVEPLFDGPVVMLTSARTFSAGEDFVAAFKTAKRGKIVGEATGGSTGSPLGFALPGGGRARVCTKRDRMGDGTEFVGRGILPDLVVGETLESLQDGRDLALSAGLKCFGK